jgi:hypothetical protein
MARWMVSSVSTSRVRRADAEAAADRVQVAEAGHGQDGLAARRLAQPLDRHLTAEAPRAEHPIVEDHGADLGLDHLGGALDGAGDRGGLVGGCVDGGEELGPLMRRPGEHGVTPPRV